MADEQKQGNINFVDTKPIFADEVALVVKVKATKNAKGDVEKEGQIEFVFIDGMKRQAIGEFVISKITAKALHKAMDESITNLEKQLADKSMPAQPEIKTTTADTSMYR